MARVIKTEVEFEGRFYEKTIVVEGEDLPAWKAEEDFAAVGEPQTRIDGLERVSGTAEYTHDIQLPGMLYGKILRSPHPHARIRSVKASAAEDLPGVHLVLSFQNTPDIPWRSGRTRLFDSTVRFSGEAVACVIAEDEDLCADALPLIEVDYAVLPAVFDPKSAMESHAPLVHESGNSLFGDPEIYERGSIDEGFQEADIIVQGTFRTQTALHNCLETHGSVAAWEGDTLILWDSTQHIHGVRDEVAGALGLPLHRVRVIKHYMGGGFGSKNQAGKYSVMAALAAKRAGRPVKILMDRHEENLTTGNRPESVQFLKVGARNDGTLTAIYHRSIINLGAYADHSASPAGPTRRLYRCANVKTEDHPVFTHIGPFSSFRAPGYVEGTFALESIMDEVAAKLGMDPLALRVHNYAEEDPITGKPYTTKGLRAAYSRGAELFGWERREAARSENARPGKKIGFGMASQVWGGSGGPPAYALLKLNPDGTAAVVTGTQDIGTGTKTALAQIAADALGCAVSAVDVQLGDTQPGPYAPLSAGSMTLASVGPAVYAAAHDARRQLMDVAAQLMERPSDELSVEGGAVVEVSQGRRTPIQDILGKLGNFMIIGRGARPPNPTGKNINTFGVQFAQVEVDLETWQVRVQRIVAVHESGRVINPLTIQNQLQGGVTQGLGFALTEQRQLDPQSGLVLNANLDHYKMPTVMDIPEIVAEMIDMPDPEANAIGAKGVGEPPIIPTAAAVANAASDALGKRVYDLPLTPDRVWALLHEAPQ